MKSINLQILIFLYSAAGASGHAFAQTHPVKAAPGDSLAARQSAARDPWLGRDKFLHLAGSAVVFGAQMYVLQEHAGLQEREALQAAAISTLAVGVTKEVVDALSHRGTASGKDLLADVIGIVLAASVFW